MDRIFDTLAAKPLDAEFIGLIHNIQKYEQAGNLYRGFSILEKNDTNNNNTAKCKGRAVERFDAIKKPG